MIRMDQRHVFQEIQIFLMYLVRSQLDQVIMVFNSKVEAITQLMLKVLDLFLQDMMQ